MLTAYSKVMRVTFQRLVAPPPIVSSTKGHPKRAGKILQEMNLKAQTANKKLLIQEMLLTLKSFT